MYVARPRGINSSIILWHAGHHTSLYSCLVEHYTSITKCIYKFDHYLEMMLHDRFSGSNISACPQPETGVSGFHLQDLFPSKIVDYVSIKDSGGKRSSDEYAIVCFPLKPKPHEVSEEWIKLHWNLSQN